MKKIESFEAIDKLYDVAFPHLENLKLIRTLEGTREEIRELINQEINDYNEKIIAVVKECRKGMKEAELEKVLDKIRSSFNFYQFIKQ